MSVRAAQDEPMNQRKNIFLFLMKNLGLTFRVELAKSQQLPEMITSPHRVTYRFWLPSPRERIICFSCVRTNQLRSTLT
jgi:hypothetical protein